MEQAQEPTRLNHSRKLLAVCYDYSRGYYYDCTTTTWNWWAYFLICLAIAVTVSIILYVLLRRYRYRQALQAQGIVPAHQSVGLAEQYPPQYAQYPQPYPPAQQVPGQYPPPPQPNVVVK